jgi:predicted  nucleic acid-binding Zn-ribbon protein
MEEIIIHQCSQVGKISTISQKLEHMDEKIKNIESNHKILHEMNTNLKIMVEQNNNRDKQIQEVQNNIAGVKADIREIKEKPLNDYDRVKWIVITIVITSISTGVLLNLGTILNSIK